MKRAAALITLAIIFFRLFALAGGVEMILDNLLPAQDDVSEDSVSAASSSPPSDGSVRDARGDAAGESPEPSASLPPSPSPSPVDGSTKNKIESDMEIRPTTISGGLAISNSTSFEPDLPALLAEGTGVTLPSDGPQILIIHTHGCEAYAQDTFDKYEESDTSRTLDNEHNVIRVGDELSSCLEEFGLNVIHDRGIYDYPSYTGSYGRSQAAVESYLAQYPDIAIVIDLHRDALGSGDVIYKTVAKVDGETSSQLMLLVGTGENGLAHPNWQENLKLAVSLQQAVYSKYPTLARPIALKQERYSQHLTTGSLILEVGSSGNTLKEALSAVRLFADAIGETLISMVESGS